MRKIVKITDYTEIAPQNALHKAINKATYNYDIDWAVDWFKYEESIKHAQLQFCNNDEHNCNIDNDSRYFFNNYDYRKLYKVIIK